MTHWFISYPRDDESRVAFKKDLLAAVETRYRALVAAGRSVMLCGDWNVAPSIIDAAYAQDAGAGGILTNRAFVESSPSRAWLARQLVRGGGGGGVGGDAGRGCRGGCESQGGAGVIDDGDDDDNGGGGGGGVRDDTEGILVDVFRQRYPRLKGAYTCWNVSSGAQLTNYGEGGGGRGCVPVLFG